jgi:putative membrane protein
MPSGNLALIYLTEWDRRATSEEIEEKHPGLLRTLAEHPGIGFLLVRSRERGPLAIGGGGVNELNGAEVEGDDPLKPFGPNAARHLARTDGFQHAPDILVNSQYHPVTEEVAAFEELVGSHGGLGGPQSKPFALVPAGWSREPDEIVGAERMHEVLCGWLAEGGIRDGKAGAAQ